LRGFCAFWISLQTPKIGNFHANFLKVSSPRAEYSRFEEILGGDYFDRHCVVGLVLHSGICWLDSLRYPDATPATNYEQIVFGSLHCHVSFLKRSRRVVGAILEFANDPKQMSAQL
jgi:hypothetical protein